MRFTHRYSPEALKAIFGVDADEVLPVEHLEDSGVSLRRETSQDEVAAAALYLEGLQTPEGSDNAA